jgi:TetR/AcrR family transcriptional repressor of lmrAB and yxaGH operons
MASDSRADMVRSAALLIGARGMNATSFTDVLAASGAPRGSIYHHFPQGKDQLTAEAVHLIGQRVLDYVQSGPTESPADVIAHFTGLFRAVIVASDAKAGCAVAGVAVDIDEEGDLLDLVRVTFRSWTNTLTERLVLAGMRHSDALPIATTTVAAMEGSLLLCRAEGTSEPIDRVTDVLLRLV